MNAIALDVGDRYVGVAATDHTDPITFRYGTIDRRKGEACDEIVRIIDERRVTVVVVGVPYHVVDGSKTQQTEKTLTFIKELRGRLGGDVQVYEVDETLTSKEAKKTLAYEEVSAKEEHAQAARIILDEYIRNHGRA